MIICQDIWGLKMKKNIDFDNMDLRPIELFENTEEAWFWCCSCRESPKDLGRRTSGPFQRPCEYVDILFYIKQLFIKNKIKKEHLEILNYYGQKQLPPHVKFGSSMKQCRIWNEAIQILGKLLFVKKIIHQI